MEIRDLANLVTIRNHLALLINSERHIIDKKMVHPYGAIKTNLDKAFLEEVVKIELGNAKAPLVVSTPKGTSGSDHVVVTGKEVSVKGVERTPGGAVVINPNYDDSSDRDVSVEPQQTTPKSFEPKNPTKKASIPEIETTEDDAAQIKKRVAAAKKKMAAKKKSSPAPILRASEQE